jgi:thiol:disulfide interchange protein
MRSFFLIFSFLSLAFFTEGQILEPVDLSFETKELAHNKVELRATVSLDKGWHVYSITTPDTSFIIGSEFNFTESSDYKFAGELVEPVPHTEYDPNFKETLSFHEGTVVFSRVIEKINTTDFEVKAEFVYQTCNEETCLPPEYIDHVFKVSGAKVTKAATVKNVASKGDEGKTTKTQKTELSVGTENSLQNGAEETGNPEKNEDVPGEKLEIDYSETDKAETKDQAPDEESEDLVDQEKEESTSMLGIFILAFLGGLAALLTPCVFPMIPLTVSFFTKQSKTRAKGITNAIIYGLAIIILYTLLGLLITVVFGSDALNAFSTNPWVNLGFFVLLVVFAISFFGAFEITLPSSWINKTDQASDKGGIVGIFFMAFTLALVSFSCTGPIIGTLLVEAASGGFKGPLIGMFGFSLALALPFALFAAFPGWLNSLPKSGGWLNSVKVVLGFIELAFAFKFLSTADLVWQAGILPREWFLAIWIAIFTLMTLYLLGKFRMPHDSPSDKVSVFKLMLAIITFSFTIYLIPGLWGAPLKLISGFPPPMFYSESPNGIGGSGNAVTASNEPIPPGADPGHCPHNINCFHDFETGRSYAKEVGKPILLDFTGWGCVNCRKMEDQVWSDPTVLARLKNDFVVISLYVDEREELAEQEKYVSEVTGKKIRTIGNKWSDFQIEHFKSNSQPQYLILGHESMKPLNSSTAYDPDIQLYLDWLKEGQDKFEK